MAKNPKRVAAGKRNRSKRGELSDDTRKRLSEAARKNRPWEKSTGPRSEDGKRRSSKNRVSSSDAVESQLNLLNDSKELLSEMAELRRAVVLDPDTAALESGESKAALLHHLIRQAATDALRRQAAEILK